MNYVFIECFLISAALKCFRRVGGVMFAFVSVQKVCSFEGAVVVTSLASQCWMSTALFIFCLVFLQIHVIVYVHTVHFD